MITPLLERINKQQAKAIDTWMKGLIGDCLYLHTYDFANPLRQKWISEWFSRNGVRLEEHNDTVTMNTVYRLYRKDELLGELRVGQLFNS